MKLNVRTLAVCMGLLTFALSGCEASEEPFVEEVGEESAEEAGDESSDEGDETAQADPACIDLVCGDVCFTSPCGEDEEEDCAAIAMQGWCDADGSCVDQEPECEVVGCEPADCGEPLSLLQEECWDGSFPTATCVATEDGACGWDIQYCPDAPEDPCYPGLCNDPAAGAPSPYCEDGKILMPADSICKIVGGIGVCEDQEPNVLEDCAAQGLICQIVDDIGECVEEDLCADFIPPCSEDTDCPNDMVCSFEGCNPSNASCDPETGEIIATADCGGGVCIETTEPDCTPEDCEPSADAIAAMECADGSFSSLECQANENGECVWVDIGCPDDLCADFIPPCSEDTDCPNDMVCSFDGCNPSEAFCDPETGVIGWTDDCGGGQCISANLCSLIECAEGYSCDSDSGACVYDPCQNLECGEPCDWCEPGTDCPTIAVMTFCQPDGSCGDEKPQCEEDLCADFIPPCEENADCPGNMVCSFEGCNSSAAFCDPATGNIGSTPDCGGGVCVEPYDPCAGKSCGDMCFPCDPNGSEDCAMEGMACNSDGQCVELGNPEEECGINLCENFIPPCSQNADCPGSMKCSSAGCNPSSAFCDPETGNVTQTEDCGGGVCVESCIPGSNVPAGDGCNTCTCPESGILADANMCTEAGCPDTACQSSAECAADEFCDFPYDNCGNGGSSGTCTKRPAVCPEIASVAGECGCNGETYNSPCEAQAAGSDYHQSGGCLSWDDTAPGFHCADKICGLDQSCSIAANDIAGPDQPEFSASCSDLQGDQLQGKCFTFVIDAWTTCFDAGGYVIIFYPGG